MAASRILKFSRFQSSFIVKAKCESPKLFYCTADTPKVENEKKPTRFSEALAKQLRELNTPEPPQKPESFASLLRNSKFINMGRFEGKEVIGTIYNVVENDLYIDFGWKFPTVCYRPRKNRDLYVRGAKVKLLIKDLELSTRFLGSTTDITLLEADCTLLGLMKSPVKHDSIKVS